MNKKYNQQGSVLALAMVFLLLTSMVAVTVMNTNLFESRMVNNEQMQQEAFSLAEAAATAILAEANNTDSLIYSGKTSCEVGSAQAGCDKKVNLIVDAGLEARVNSHKVVSLNSIKDTGLQVLDPDLAAGGSYYYEVEVVIDNTAAGQGRSKIVVGARQDFPSNEEQSDGKMSQDR